MASPTFASDGHHGFFLQKTPYKAINWIPPRWDQQCDSGRIRLMVERHGFLIIAFLGEKHTWKSFAT